MRTKFRSEYLKVRDQLEETM